MKKVSKKAPNGINHEGTSAWAWGKLIGDPKTIKKAEVVSYFSKIFTLDDLSKKLKNSPPKWLL
jgi:hypothetical protein